METQQQRNEKILTDLVSVRNRMVTGNRDSALKKLDDIKEELDAYQGIDRAHVILLAAYGEAVKCANSSGLPGEIKESSDFREFQKYLGLAVERIRPQGMDKLPDSKDDVSATRPY